jgi:hypothetical protein
MRSTLRLGENSVRSCWTALESGRAIKPLQQIGNLNGGPYAATPRFDFPRCQFPRKSARSGDARDLN